MASQSENKPGQRRLASEMARGDVDVLAKRAAVEAAKATAVALAAADACAVIDYMYVYITEFILLFTTVAHILLQLY